MPCCTPLAMGSPWRARPETGRRARARSPAPARTEGTRRGLVEADLSWWPTQRAGCLHKLYRRGRSTNAMRKEGCGVPVRGRAFLARSSCPATVVSFNCSSSSPVVVAFFQSMHPTCSATTTHARRRYFIVSYTRSPRPLLCGPKKKDTTRFDRGVAYPPGISEHAYQLVKFV